MGGSILRSLKEGRHEEKYITEIKTSAVSTMRPAREDNSSKMLIFLGCGVGGSFLRSKKEG